MADRLMDSRAGRIPLTDDQGARQLTNLVKAAFDPPARKKTLLTVCRN